MSLTCSRCLLSENVPGVKVEAKGICSVCREYDKNWGHWDKCKTERLVKLDRLFDDVRRKKLAYDVLIPLSGGKDSTYVLYVCRKRFGLKCLAVTWDMGFLTEHARENIKNAVNVLGVDHVYYTVNRQLLMALYRFFFLKTGFFCPVCMRGIGVTIERAASAFNIPLVITGTSHRTEEYVAPEFFLAGDLGFFKEVLKGDPLEKEALALMYGRDWTRIIKRMFTYTYIDLPDYLDWNYDEIFKRISSDLGWKAHRADAEHSDCKVDNIVNYIRYIKFPALIPEMLRFSKLVTAGQMTREEAKWKVSKNRAVKTEPDNLDWFLDTLQVSREQMNTVLADRFRHMRYIKNERRLWHAIGDARSLLLNAILGWRSRVKLH